MSSRHDAGVRAPALGNLSSQASDGPSDGRELIVAFAPGRVNLIGEHTDYNGGLALPFAIGVGVTVTAALSNGDTIDAEARDLGERDSFAIADPPPADGWKGFVHGVVAELGAAGYDVPAARLVIGGELPRGAGLSSSAALTIALTIALLRLSQAAAGSPIELAQLASRVEHEWLGADTGLLDQLAILCAAPGRASLIDFASLSVEPVPLALGEWRLALLDSGRRHDLSDAGDGGYRRRREECERAAELLELPSLREATLAAAQSLPAPLDLRVRHVVAENRRVEATVAALRRGDFFEVGHLLDLSHASLRDHFEVSTPEVERTVARAKAAGAVGARIVGGGFGGNVLGLFPPGIGVPADSREVRPRAGARLL